MPNPDPSEDLGRIDSVASEDEVISADVPTEASQVEGTLPRWKRLTFWCGSAFQRIGGWGDGDDEIESRPDLSASEAVHRAWSAKQEHRARVTYLNLQTKFAGRLYRLVRCWLALVIFAVFLNGFGGFPWAKFELTDRVLMTFITSTTASVLGLFVLVAKWLFASTRQRPSSGTRKKKAIENP